ncbi:hypothetical protein ACQ4PT_063110 [Festuca glaucescens]
MGAPPVLRQPTDKPPFTLAEIKKAIPPHCFERSLIKSSYYLLHDLFIVAALVYFATAAACGSACGPSGTSAATTPSRITSCSTTPWAWCCTPGCSSPYFSWKYSHRRHHSNRGSLERDENFVPQQKAALAWYAPYAPYIEGNAAGRLLLIAVRLILGWPLYLTFNSHGRAYPRWANHFDPYGPIFSDRERALVFVTDVSLLAVWFALFKLASAFGFWSVVRVYGGPLLVVNAWLVLIVYLHHTHQALPHYDSSEWDWLRGALATVDRDYGVLNYFFHHIADTHVLHHLFSAMPHYHAWRPPRRSDPSSATTTSSTPRPSPGPLARDQGVRYVESMEDGKGVFWYTNKF